MWPQILATFSESDADYIVYRTFMGQGGCAGGEVFVLKFYRYGQGNIGVTVSPRVEACIGELPTVSFAFGRSSYVISVSGYEIETDGLSRWKEPAPAGNRNRRSRSK
jgi:hypothetical protein